MFGGGLIASALCSCVSSGGGGGGEPEPENYVWERPNSFPEIPEYNDSDVVLIYGVPQYETNINYQFISYVFSIDSTQGIGEITVDFGDGISETISVSSGRAISHTYQPTSISDFVVIKITMDNNTYILPYETLTPSQTTQQLGIIDTTLWEIYCGANAMVTFTSIGTVTNATRPIHIEYKKTAKELSEILNTIANKNASIVTTFLSKFEINGLLSEQLPKAIFRGSAEIGTLVLSEYTILPRNFLNNNRVVKKLILPNVIEIEAAAINNCSALEKIEAPNLQIIGQNNFISCPALKEIDFPKITEITYACFNACSSLKKISMESLERIQLVTKGAVFSCANLTKLNVPRLQIIDNVSTLFSGCVVLTKIQLDNLTKLNAERIFSGCYSLKEINLPLLSDMNNNCVVCENCTTLEVVNMPLISEIGGDSFNYCYKICEAHFANDFKTNSQTGGFMWRNSTIPLYVKPTTY